MMLIRSHLLMHCSSGVGGSGKSECCTLYSRMFWAVLSRRENRVLRARVVVKSIMHSMDDAYSNAVPTSSPSEKYRSRMPATCF